MLKNKEEILMESKLTVCVVGAGGKMGTRVTNNLMKKDYNLLCCENSEKGVQGVMDRGLKVYDTEESVRTSDVVVLAVPDVLLGKVSSQLVPLMKKDAILLTLDPSAAYAGQIFEREDLTSVVAHPCHPSVFLERYTKEEYEDNFGGAAALQDVITALHYGDEEKYPIAEKVAADMYAPVGKCHRVTVYQATVLEPTLVETVVCMISTIIKEAMEETVKLGVPEEAAKAILLGHIQIALTNTLKGSNPFSDACMIAIDLGKKDVINPDWKKIFNREALDETVNKMLKLEPVHA
jgi:D-apionate oxidoisomerase